MPISDAIAESNRAQTERLRRLAERLTPDMPAVRLPNGWTVAVALAHIQFDKSIRPARPGGDAPRTPARRTDAPPDGPGHGPGGPASEWYKFLTD
jgi:hypothetical protein